MRNVIVTGGSRGLGLGIARRLSEAGHRAITVARKMTDQLASAIEVTERIRPGSLHFVACDLAEIDKIPAFVKSLRKQFGPIYGLVNNAALGLHGPLALMHNSQIERLVRINTVSPIVLTKFVIRTMMAEGEGRIVNVASIAAATGFSGLSVYSATKASLVGFTRALAREVGQMGVNVNAVAPGFVDTDMTRDIDQSALRQIVRRSALRRLADVDDVANAVVFLFSEGARSISGTVLTVDAGSTA
ncbi:MAG TPA: SDR family oxidoreductase [Terriglobales bacterium]|nr:SDR family oxidoreductase [Terriglobales bacterium]